jgi:hypothetical protein
VGNNPAAVNYMQHQFNPLIVSSAALKLNNGALASQRVSADDSLTHLLVLNASTASYIEPGAMIYELNGKAGLKQPVKPSGEVYDDISLRDEESEQMRRKEQQHRHTAPSVKLNEYCYIHANGLVIGNIENHNQQNVKAEIPIEVTTTDEIQPRSSADLNSPRSMASISPKTMTSSMTHMTSTPSLPKTMPPTFNKLESIELDDVVDLNNENTLNKEASTAYQTCPDTISTTLVQDQTVKLAADAESNTYLLLNPYPESIRNESEYNDDDYQIPTNYPHQHQGHF